MNLRVLSLSYPEEIDRYMEQLDVYRDAIRIMASKANCFLVSLEGIPSVAANILKQEMLSIAGEVAVPKGVIMGSRRNTNCLIIGNLNQFRQLSYKLKKQPFGLANISGQLNNVLSNYLRKRFILNTTKHKLILGRRTLIMGIINLTPDSFSGDGLYNSTYIYRNNRLQDLIVKDVEKMIKDGADIIDIGGESTRPGSEPINVREEIRRVIPAIKNIVKKMKVPISIDSYKPEVVKAALDAGADIVNNIMGTDNNLKLHRLVARYRAGYIIMHIKGKPRTMQRNPRYKTLMGEITNALRQAINSAIEAGVDRERIIVDPGIGFGKTTVHNLEIIKRLNELKTLGRPIMVGPSRKSFIGNVLNLPVTQRLMGTAAAVAISIRNGAHIVRIHDVKKIKEVVKLTDSILNPN
jgi:dihydropteroate synthase